MPTKRVLLLVLAISVVVLATGAGPWAAGTAIALAPEQGPGAGATTIPYSGQLTDMAGQAVADGTYALRFTAYEAETGGQPLWSEVQASVAVRAGLFATELGTDQPLSPGLLAGQALWLELGVRGPGESEFTALTPRQRVSTAPATSGAMDDMACPHTHVGEVWNAAIGWSLAGFRVNNSKNGPSIWGWNSGGGNGLRGDSRGVGIGVYGEGEDAPGIVGRSKTNYGVEGVSADGQGGVWAHSSGGYGLFAHSDNNHSIHVDGAGKNGVNVQSAGDHGVYVHSAGWDGVAVNSASVAGVYVHSAGQDGILVDSAGWDGVHVVGPVGGSPFGSGMVGNEDFLVLNSGEVRSKVGFASASHGYAETVPVETLQAGYEPGDVLVASTAGKGALALSSLAYSPAVVGVYSASPAFVAGQPVPEDQQADGLPVTLLGIVPCKVSAENGPIRLGDLLVTSSTAGHAMRADDPPAGTILGKALEAFEDDAGLIQVLVMLR